MVRGRGGLLLRGGQTHSHASHAWGVATVLVLPSGAKLGLLSAHMPHHATIARAEALMSQWGESRALASREVLLGIDANEISNE